MLRLYVHRNHKAYYNIRDEEPRTATSVDFHTVPVLWIVYLESEFLLLNVHGGEKAYLGTGTVGEGKGGG